MSPSRCSSALEGPAQRTGCPPSDLADSFTGSVLGASTPLSHGSPTPLSRKLLLCFWFFPSKWEHVQIATSKKEKKTFNLSHFLVIRLLFLYREALYELFTASLLTNPPPAVICPSPLQWQNCPYSVTDDLCPLWIWFPVFLLPWSYSRSCIIFPYACKPATFCFV